MDEPVDLPEKLALVDEPFSPRVVGYYDDDKLVVARVEGEFVWPRGTPNVGDADAEAAPEIEI